MTARATNAAIFRERIYPHWAVLLFLLMLSVSLGIAYGDALGLTVGLATFVVCLALSAGLYFRSSVLVELTSKFLRVNRAQIELKYLGHPEILDAQRTKSASGRNASAQAYIQILSGIGTSVLVPITDESDPHPYWHFSSRNPAQLVKALEEISALS